MKSLSLIIISIALGLFSLNVIGEALLNPNGHAGFSGIEYHMPNSTRLTWYKYKAKKNKLLSEGGQLDDDLSSQFSRTDRTVNIGDDIYSECAVNIGNIDADSLFGRTENVVIIDGDVVNAGECD